jgi:predicted SprT family Zn-dependent metalloprotease
MNKILFKKIKKISEKYSELPLTIVYTDTHMDNVKALVEVRNDEALLYVNIFKSKTPEEIIEAIAHEIAHVNIFVRGGKINSHGVKHLNESDFLNIKIMEEYNA